MKTVVLGLGNSLRADDGVGLYVARAVRKLADSPSVAVAESSGSGLDVLDHLCGFDRAIIVDAIQTGEGRPGDIRRLPAPISGRHLTNPHSTDLATALEIGRQLGLPLPSDITFFGVEIADCDSFSECCSPPVDAAVDRCAKLVLETLLAHSGRLNSDRRDRLP